MVSNNFRSTCPISTGLEIFGDKWTLLIIRDMIFGKARFKEFAEGKERIPTNILSSRLKSLVEQGFIMKEPYQLKPKRYQYTLLEKGNDLIPIMQAMAKWSTDHIEERDALPIFFWETL